MKNVPVIEIDNHFGETDDSVGEISNGVGGIQGSLHYEGIECICCLTKMIGNDLKLLLRHLMYH